MVHLNWTKGKYFPLYYMFAWFSFVIFFSLVLVCTCLSILVYLQCTKYGIVFAWLMVAANKFVESVSSFHKQLYFCHQKSIKKQTGYASNFLQPPINVWKYFHPYLKIVISFSAAPSYSKISQSLLLKNLNFLSKLSNL